MQSIKKFTSSITLLTKPIPYFFTSGDNWQKRDQASQKIYITNTEKQTIKRLLKKVELQSEERLQDSKQFQGKLKEILKKHNVNNEAFVSQITNLHKTLYN